MMILISYVAKQFNIQILEITNRFINEEAKPK